MQILWETIYYRQHLGRPYGNANLFLPYDSTEYLKRIMSLRNEELQLWHDRGVISKEVYNRVLERLDEMIRIIKGNPLDLTDDEILNLTVNISIIQALFLLGFNEHVEQGH
jgi:hypothetical protein